MGVKQKNLPIEWDLQESKEFRNLIKDIKKRSEHLAARIKSGLLVNLKLVSENPYLFEQDNLKEGNDGSFRKFTVIHIRFVYKIEPTKIIIARVRHAASEPSPY